MVDDNAGFFDPSNEQLERFMEAYGHEDGTYDLDKFEAFMSGDLELDEPSDSDTLTGDKPDEEDSQSSEARAPELDEASSGDKAEDQDAEAGKAKEATGEPSEPVVQAKDGEHVIPFSVLEDLRTEVSALKEQNTELRELLESDPEVEKDIEKAVKEDLESGDNLATAEIFADLEEDFPGIGKKLHETLVAPLQAAMEKLNKIDELAADKASRDAEMAKSAAQQAFEADIAKIDGRYEETIADKRFWDWFDQQPAFYQASMKSTDPSHFASIVTQWNDSVLPTVNKEAEAAAVPAKKAITSEEVAEKAESAAKEARNKSSVETLSDVPGSVTNPEEDEIHATISMSTHDLREQMLEFDPDTIEKKLSRIL